MPHYLHYFTNIRGLSYTISSIIINKAAFFFRQGVNQSFNTCKYYFSANHLLVKIIINIYLKCNFSFFLFAPVTYIPLLYRRKIYENC